jgi:hypothetical protein
MDISEENKKKSMFSEFSFELISACFAAELMFEIVYDTKHLTPKVECLPAHIACIIVCTIHLCQLSTNTPPKTHNDTL